MAISQAQYPMAHCAFPPGGKERVKEGGEKRKTPGEGLVRRVEDGAKIGYGNFKAVLDGGGRDGLLFGYVYNAGSLKVGEESGFIWNRIVDYEVHYG